MFQDVPSFGSLLISLGPGRKDHINLGQNSVAGDWMGGLEQEALLILWMNHTLLNCSILQTLHLFANSLDPWAAEAHKATLLMRDNREPSDFSS